MDQKLVTEIEVPVSIINIVKDLDENTVFENVSYRYEFIYVLFLMITHSGRRGKKK
jgi:hypothetical protein